MEISLNLTASGLPAHGQQTDDDAPFSPMSFNLPSLALDQRHDELYKDADVTDCVLLPRTFWLPSGASPKNNFERMAKSVFDFHSKRRGHQFDESRSGAEWWCQVRPSPPSGRYSATAEDNGLSKEGVVFHYDKDEELAEMTGIHVFPHVSTITYLTNIGAPTFILDRHVDDIQQGSSWQRDGGNVGKGYVSYPTSGKHTCFDGRCLHAVVSELKSKSLEDEVKDYRESLKDDDDVNAIRSGRRITFLVNCWYDHKPINITRWGSDGPFSLSDNNGDVYSKIFENVESTEVKSVNAADDADKKSFTYVMGKDEQISISSMPISSLQRDHEKGGTVEIIFEKGGMKIERVDDVDNDTDERESKRKKVS